MRFKRADLLGIAVAALIPAVLSYVIFQSWHLLHTEGTPIQGAIAGNFAVGGGLIAYLTRYVIHRRAFIGIAVAFGLCVVGVIWLQFAGSGNGALATALKWLGVIAFNALNVVLIADVLAVAVNPYFVRLDERRAAAAAAAE